MIDHQPESYDIASVVACFDLDGVLVDSEATKMSAFRLAVQQILQPAVETAEQIDKYNRLHRGVPRRDKFTVATRLVTGRHDEATVRALMDSYAALLTERLPAVRAMPGAVEFTDAWPGPRALATSAPRDEAHSHLRRLAFPRFGHVFDARTSKTAALRVLSGDGQVPVVFFGGARADSDAAVDAAAAFVAVGDSISDLDPVSVLASVASLANLLGTEHELARSVLAWHQVRRNTARR